MSIKFILHQRTKNSPKGLIYCQIIENRKKRYKSLKLPAIPVSAWNEKTQRVRRRKDINYDYLNRQIDKYHKEILSKERVINNREGKLSFITFFQNYLQSPQLAQKHSTRAKYGTVLNKLKSFLQSIDKADLLFEDFSVELLHQLKNYLVSSIDHNTAINYLKVIHGIVRKAQKEPDFYSVQNPFINFQYPKPQKKKRKSLTPALVEKIKNGKLSDVGLIKIRSKFLFQLFANGMRISDLILFRYGNLRGGRVHYTMVKTNNEVSFPLNLNHIILLSDFIDFTTNLNTAGVTTDQKLLNNLSHFMKLQSDKNVPLCLIVVDERKDFDLLTRGMYQAMTIEQLNDELRIIAKEKFLGKLTDNSESLDILEEHESVVKQNIDRVKSQYLKATFAELNQLATENPTGFVFDLCSDKSINNQRLTRDQYTMLHHKRIVYNRQLKRLSNALGLPVSLTSKDARTAFANLVINLPNVNTQLVSGALAHSSLQVTQHYINGFDSAQQDEITNTVGRLFG